MKERGILILMFLITLFTGVSIADANSASMKQILQFYPQADQDSDGELSRAEEQALERKILKKFSQVDKNGDGKLSDAEKKAILRQVSSRKKQKSPKKSGTANGKISPTHANVKYGKHERNVFDIWLAKSEKPTPLAIYIHGGGFRSGSKEKLKAEDLSALLKAGISVAAINYRYMSPETPMPTPHNDARRALQFMRSKAKIWNIDKNKVATFGGSAGAQICMWLAFSDEMAKPDSKDPIKRESTRLTCVATTGGQTGNSLEFWKKTVGPILGDKHKIESFFRPIGGETDPEKVRITIWGAKSLKEANEKAKRHTALHLISPDDPPIYMKYNMSPADKLPTSRNKKRLRGWLIHHVNLGVALKKKSDAIGVENYLQYPGANIKYPSQSAFLIDKLIADK